jgi:hypothetical protein
MALRDRLVRLEARIMPSVALPDRAASDRLHERIASAVQAVEGVLGAPDNVSACSLVERVARLHGLTGGVAFPWWPALRHGRRSGRWR